MIGSRTGSRGAILQGAVVTAGFSACASAFFGLLLVVGHKVFGNFHEPPMPMLLCGAILGTAVFATTLLLTLVCAFTTKHAVSVKSIAAPRTLPALAERASALLFSPAAGPSDKEVHHVAAAANSCASV